MTVVVHRGNPAQLVEEAFTRIWRERMEGLPIVNPVLRVEAIGVRRWAGQWLGVLVTPWAMSVLLLPASVEAWVRVPEQERRFVKFPFGDLAFLGGDEPGLGEYQTCSLFSPMDRFASHADACEVASASLAALMAPPPQADAPPAVAPAHPSSSLLTPRAAAPSRRRFLGLRA